MDDGWEMQKPGWYTHPALGGIVKSAEAGWRWYPLGDDTEHGPYLTLTKAKAAAQQQGSVKEQAETEMSTLVGREFDFHGVADNCFRLGDTVYEAVEDEDDGYRSMLGWVRVVDAAGRPFFKTPIARVKVVVGPDSDESYQTDETWDLVDLEDGHVWLSLGTRNTDDYYPWFAFEYEPKQGTP